MKKNEQTKKQTHIFIGQPRGFPNHPNSLNPPLLRLHDTCLQIVGVADVGK